MNIFQILNASDFLNESEVIDIAKGKYEYPNSWKKIINHLKRNRPWQKK